MIFYKNFVLTTQEFKIQITFYNKIEQKIFRVSFNCIFHCAGCRNYFSFRWGLFLTNTALHSTNLTTKSNCCRFFSSWSGFWVEIWLRLSSQRRYSFTLSKKNKRTRNQFFFTCQSRWSRIWAHQIEYNP